MCILLVNEFGKDAREVQFSQEEVRIGRDPEGEIVLEDQGVSRTHARILRKEKDYLLEDLGSRNGTRINEKRLPPQGSSLLRNGDIIQVGRSVIRFILKVSRKISTGLKRIREATAAVEAVERAGAARGRQELCLFKLQKIQASLIVVREGRPTARHILESDRVRIGTGPDSDINLMDPSVSGQHAEIVYNKEGFHLVDRDSEMGTYLDGISIRLSRLAHRSFIRFGKVKALFTFREEGKEAPEASFALRDHLAGLYPDRAEMIHGAFRESRESACDFAEEIVLRGALDPEEWWAATSRFQEPPSTGPKGWIPGFFRKLRGDH